MPRYLIVSIHCNIEPFMLCKAHTICTTMGTDT